MWYFDKYFYKIFNWLYFVTRKIETNIIFVQFYIVHLPLNVWGTTTIEYQRWSIIGDGMLRLETSQETLYWNITPRSRFATHNEISRYL